MWGLLWFDKLLLPQALRQAKLAALEEAGVPAKYRAPLAVHSFAPAVHG